MASLPLGTVTFLFTDIEGSTRLLQHLGEKYATVIMEHDQLLRDVWQKHNGSVVGTQGDSFFVAFPGAIDGINAAVDAQRVLASHSWTDGVKVRVRMGLHTGEPQISASENYVGIDVHRAARIAAAAHGGQVLLSQETYELVNGQLPDGMTLKDLGVHRLKDLRQPKHLYQLIIEGLPSDFPPLKSLKVSVPNNLPIQLTSFIGRKKELAQVHQLLTQARLLTLTGVGGCGKTRLARQVAGEVAVDRSYNGGVWFVELAALNDPTLVPQEVAQTLEIREVFEQSAVSSLIDYLADKRLFLVLDNCEHLIEQVASLGPHLAGGGRDRWRRGVFERGVTSLDVDGCARGRALRAEGGDLDLKMHGDASLLLDSPIGLAEASGNQDGGQAATVKVQVRQTGGVAAIATIRPLRVGDPKRSASPNP